MARRAVTQYFDDLDSTHLDENQVNVVDFGFQGTDYTLDLSAENAKKLKELLAPYIEVARKKVGNRAANGRSPQSRANTQRNREIREWALQKGLNVSKRGRLSADIIEQYEQENS